jgi:hypothetical protein
MTARQKIWYAANGFEAQSQAREKGELEDSGGACQPRRSRDVFWPDDTVAFAGAGPSFTSSVSDDDTVGCCWFCVVRATASRVRSKISSTERVEELIS